MATIFTESRKREFSGCALISTKDRPLSLVSLICCLRTAELHGNHLTYASSLFSRLFPSKAARSFVEEFENPVANSRLLASNWRDDEEDEALWLC